MNPQVSLVTFQIVFDLSYIAQSSVSWQLPPSKIASWIIAPQTIAPWMISHRIIAPTGQLSLSIIVLFQIVAPR